MTKGLQTKAELSPAEEYNLFFAFSAACLTKVTGQAEAVELLTRLSLLDMLQLSNGKADKWRVYITPELLARCIAAGGVRAPFAADSVTVWTKRVLNHALQDTRSLAKNELIEAVERLNVASVTDAALDNPFALNN